MHIEWIEMHASNSMNVVNNLNVLSNRSIQPFIISIYETLFPFAVNLGRGQKCIKTHFKTKMIDQQ